MSHINEIYEKSLDYLYGLINFEVRRHDRYMANKLDSTRPHHLMAVLGNPHQRFPAIHIAGTKGKGSVAAMCAASLHAAGYKVGLYTSPHVQEFRERIRVLSPEDEDGRISKADFVTLLDEMKTAVTLVEGVTWFEVVTGIAFLHFARQEVDVAVVEVGLGGRLDATNVLTPLVSIITSLSYDHTDFLGDTLEEIAWEKGGIIKTGVPVIAAPQQPEAQERLLEIAIEREAPISIVGRNWRYEGEKRIVKNGSQALIVKESPTDFISTPSTFSLSLAGDHQLENGMVALAALATVRTHLPKLTLEAIRRGLETVTWNGRLQIIHQTEHTPTILADCAHNWHSAATLRHALSQDYTFKRLCLIFGATMGKDIRGMLTELLPLTERTIATISTHPRACTPETIAELGAELGFTVESSPNITAAVHTAWQWAAPDDLICVTGSIFVVGDLLNQWENLQHHLLLDETAQAKTTSVLG